MLSRFISRASHLRLLTLTISNPQCPKPIYSSSSSSSSSSPNPNLAIFLTLSKSFCSNHSNNGDNNDRDQFQSNIWKISQEDDQDGDSVFGEDEGNLAGIAGGDDEHQTWPKVDHKGGRSRDGHGDGEEKPWTKEEAKEGDVFADVDKEFGDKDGGDEWATSEKDKPWDLGAEEKDDNLFGIGEEKEEGGIGVAEDGIVVTERSEEEIRLEKEEQELKSILKGPNRAFGDLVAASGITDAMLDNLIALKDFEGVDGLPPLSEIEDIRLEKNTKKSTRFEIERQKQEEVAQAHVRKVDENGVAHGVGRRKCAVARVWLQPGDGTFMVNGRHFDIYFPSLEHRADLLRPFTETKTLGRWSIDCKVRGGGWSGQAGAVRLGISRALQNWEPGLRPALRNSGLLTRDSRVVERKKYGHKKARKSFQWVKR